MKHLFFLFAICFSASLLAEAFPKADAKEGKKLFAEAKCSTCHVSMVGGDGTKIFTRPDRKIKSAAALLSQVQFCKAQLNVGWFPEDEEHVAAYLNQQYYKFK